MGSGKSTLGPLLARELGYRFIDLDSAIEDRAEKTIPQLFEDHGEAYFRDLESQAIQAVVSRKQVVVALGGGAFIDEGNRRRLTQSGVTVWLDVDVEVLFERLERKAKGRPLLAGSTSTGRELQGHISAILRRRKASYRRADIRFRPLAGSTPRDNARLLAGTLTRFQND